MDPMLAKIMESNTPALNPDLANGLALKHIKQVPAQIDSLFRAVAVNFPPELGLTYDGYMHCSPLEEYRELTRRKSVSGGSNKCIYNLARTDSYMVKYLFSFRGEPMVKYISLPFINHQGYLHLYGVRRIVQPVLCDKIISIGKNNVFVKLNRAKLIIRYDPEDYIANGVRESIPLIWSNVYNRSNKNKDLIIDVKASTTLGHYLFCRFGVTETFKQFGDCEPVFGYEEEITESKYPANEWVICESVGLKPKSLSLPAGAVYKPTKLRLAIRKEQYTNKAKNFIVTLFYLADHWPYLRVEELDSTRKWKQLLGELIWGSAGSHIGRLEQDAEKHLSSLDTYIDVIIESKFRQTGWNITSLYQLFGLIMENLTSWLLSDDVPVSDLYNKELQILYYLVGDVQKGINKFLFSLKSSFEKKSRMEYNEVLTMLNRHVGTNMTSSLNKVKNHPEITTVSTSCDNRAFKSTALLLPQDSTGAGDQDKSADDPSYQLHTSVAEVAVYSAINKSEPAGTNRLNLCVNVDESGNIVRNPKFKELLDTVQKQIDRTL